MWCVCVMNKQSRMRLFTRTKEYTNDIMNNTIQTNEQLRMGVRMSEYDGTIQTNVTIRMNVCSEWRLK